MTVVLTTKTGRPVQHGKRNSYVNHGCRCDPCRKADRDYMAARRASNPRVREVNRTASRRRRAADPERYRAYNRADKRRRRDKIADDLRCRTYRLQPGEYARRLAEQDGKCLICRTEPVDGRALDVDHHHESGDIRGLLCRRHNLGLGFFGDDPALLRAAAAYLEAAPANRMPT